MRLINHVFQALLHTLIAEWWFLFGGQGRALGTTTWTFATPWQLAAARLPLLQHSRLRSRMLDQAKHMRSVEQHGNPKGSATLRNCLNWLREQEQAFSQHDQLGPDLIH